MAFEAPWNGVGSGDVRRVFAAASSRSRGWTGAALYAEQAGALVPLGPTGNVRSVVGHTATALPPSAAMLLERDGVVEIDMVSPDFQLADASPETLADGANRVLIGGEVLQFVRATGLGGARWRLQGLLRGRGGTEAAAMAGHPVGADFVLLDERPVLIDPAGLGSVEVTALAAIGLADDEPARAPIANSGLTLRPLTPVHAGVSMLPDGGLRLQWARRARGAWNWPDGVETPLNEQTEAYLVGLGDPDQPALRWQLAAPELELSAATLAQLLADHSGAPLWVRQVGSFTTSAPLLLTIIV